MKNTAVSLRIICCAMLLVVILAAGSTYASQGSNLNHFYTFEMEQPVLSIPSAGEIKLRFLNLPIGAAFSMESSNAEMPSAAVAPAEDGSAEVTLSLPAAEKKLELSLLGDDVLYWSALLETTGEEIGDSSQTVILTVDWLMLDDAVLLEDGTLAEGLQEITGSTAPGIRVIASLANNETEESITEAVADKSGRFSLELERAISTGDKLCLRAGGDDADILYCELNFTACETDVNGEKEPQIDEDISDMTVSSVKADRTGQKIHESEIIIETPEPEQNGYILSFEDEKLVFSGSAEADAELEWAIFEADNRPEFNEPTPAPTPEVREGKSDRSTRKPRTDSPSKKATPTPKSSPSAGVTTAVPTAEPSTPADATSEPVTVKPTDVPKKEPDNKPSDAPQAPSDPATSGGEQGTAEDTPKKENAAVDKKKDDTSIPADQKEKAAGNGDTAVVGLVCRRTVSTENNMPKRRDRRQTASTAGISGYAALSIKNDVKVQNLKQTANEDNEDDITKPAIEGSISVGSDGKWRIEIPIEKLSEGIVYRLVLSYAGDEDIKECYFRVDFAAPEIEGLNETILSADELISGITEPNAKLSLTINDDRSYNTTADANGEFSFELEDIAPGDMLLVTAIDTAGRSSEYRILVVSNIAIELSENQYSFIGDKLIISGTAAQNQVLILKREDTEITEIIVSDTGEWQGQLNAGVFEGVADQLNFSINYKDGLPEEAASFSIKIDVDESCALELKPCKDMDTKVSGTTDPDARLVLKRVGFADINTTADEKGSFVFELSKPLKPADRVSVHAEDERGNSIDKQLEIRAAETVTPIKYNISNMDGVSNEAQLDGSAMADMVLVVYINDIATLDLRSDAEGKFSAKLEKLAEGDNRICIRYGEGHFAHYSSDESLVTVDLTAPVLTLKKKSFNSASHTVSGTLSEDAYLSILLNDEELLCEKYPAGDFQIDTLELNAGDVLMLQASDVAGNSSAPQSFEVLEALKLVGHIDEPEPDMELECDQKLEIRGWVAAADEISNLYLRISPEGGFDGKDYEDFNVAIISDSAIADRLTDEEKNRMDVADCARFEYSLELSDLPIGQMDIELIVKLDGEQHQISGARLKAGIIKPADYISKRVFILAVLFVLLLSMILLLFKINRALRTARNTVLDSNRRSRLTIKNRKEG